MGYKAYPKDYKLSDRLDAKGRPVYIYEGVYFHLTLQDTALRRYKAKICVLSVCALVLYVLIGLLNTPAGHSFYVMLPYAGALLPLLFLLSGAYNTLITPQKMKREQYDKSVLRIWLMGIWLCVLSALCATGLLVYVLTQELHIADGLFLVGALGICGAGLWAVLLGNYAKKCTNIES